MSKKLSQAKNPIVIVGSDALQREDGGAVMSYTQQIAARLRQTSGCGQDWAVLNVLNRVASQVSSASQNKLLTIIDKIYIFRSQLLILVTRLECPR